MALECPQHVAGHTDPALEVRGYSEGWTAGGMTCGCTTERSWKSDGGLGTVAERAVFYYYYYYSINTRMRPCPTMASPRIDGREGICAHRRAPRSHKNQRGVRATLG